MAATSETYDPPLNTEDDVDDPITASWANKLFKSITNIHERLGIGTGAGQNIQNHKHLGLGVDGSDIIALTVPVLIFDDGQEGSPYTKTTSAYATEGLKHYFYVSSTATKTLQILFSAKIASAGGTWGAQIRLNGSAPISAEQSDNNTSFADYTTTLDITSLSVGWHYYELRFRGTSGQGLASIQRASVAAV